MRLVSTRSLLERMTALGKQPAAECVAAELYRVFEDNGVEPDAETVRAWFIAAADRADAWQSELIGANQLVQRVSDAGRWVFGFSVDDLALVLQLYELRGAGAPELVRARAAEMNALLGLAADMQCAFCRPRALAWLGGPEAGRSAPPQERLLAGDIEAVRQALRAHHPLPEWPYLPVHPPTPRPRRRGAALARYDGAILDGFQLSLRLGLLGDTASESEVTAPLLSVFSAAINRRDGRGKAAYTMADLRRTFERRAQCERARLAADPERACMEARRTIVAARWTLNAADAEIATILQITPDRLDAWRRDDDAPVADELAALADLAALDSEMIGAFDRPSEAERWLRETCPRALSGQRPIEILYRGASRYVGEMVRAYADALPDRPRLLG